MKRLTLFAMAAAFSFASSAALAADLCVSTKQADGSTWMTCVKDNGQTYCQACPADGTACSVVACK